MHIDDKEVDESQRRALASATATVARTKTVSVAASGQFWWPLLVGLVAAILCAPFIYSVWLGDEGILLHGADQMLQGRRLYIDFFEFLPPGGFVITAAWLTVAGISMSSARWLAILTIAGIAVFTYLACRQASKHTLSSILIAVGWVIMSQGLWTEINHHWFTTLFSMVAAWATIASFQHPQRLREPVIAGIAAGAAAMVIPTRGALAVLAAATAFVDLRQHRDKAIAYLLGSALVPLCLLGYVAWQHALGSAFDDVIVFAATRYASVQSVIFSAWATDQNLPLRYLFPLTLLLTLCTYACYRRACLQDNVLRSCAAFGLAGLIGCFPRPDMTHIAFAAPLVCPLLAFCMRLLTRWWRPKYRYAAAAVLIGLCIPSVRSFWSISLAALGTETVPTPRGNVTFGQDGARELVLRISSTPPGEAYFFYPYMPMLPFLTARRQVSRFDVFLPGYTLPSQYEEACVSAMKRASWVVIDRDLTDPGNLRKIFPAMRNAEHPETKRFERALESGFEFVAREGPFEMRHRAQVADKALCSAISE
jgi:hypothetical protein